MVKLSSPCRAKDPATCTYHGYEVRASAYIEQGLYDDALRELATRDRLEIQHEDNDQKAAPAQPVDKIGVHTSHCCNIHGCKYGNKNCPVQTGTREQEYACEYCSWQVDEYITHHGEMKTHYKTITAVDPDGCGCTECLTGQYIPESTWRIHAKAGDIKNVLYQKVRNNTGKPLSELLETGDFTSKSATHFQQILNGTTKIYDIKDTWGM